MTTTTLAEDIKAAGEARNPPFVGESVEVRMGGGATEFLRCISANDDGTWQGIWDGGDEDDNFARRPKWIVPSEEGDPMAWRHASLSWRHAAAWREAIIAEAEAATEGRAA